MSEHDPRTFTTLPCPACDGIAFVSVLHLRHKPGGGLVPESKGFACLGCQTVVDIAQVLQASTLKQKREELRSLEEELGVTHYAAQRWNLSREDNAKGREDSPAFYSGGAGERGEESRHRRGAYTQRVPGRSEEEQAGESHDGRERDDQHGHEVGHGL